MYPLKWYRIRRCHKCKKIILAGIYQFFCDKCSPFATNTNHEKKLEGETLGNSCITQTKGVEGVTSTVAEAPDLASNRNKVIKERENNGK